MTSTATTPLEAALDELKQETNGATVALGDLLDRLEQRPLGLTLVILGLLVSLPVIGAIPGLPNIVALAVLFAVGHALIGGTQHFYAPRSLREKSVDAARVDGVLRRIRPAAKWVDGLLASERFDVLTRSYAARIALGCAAAGLALLLIPLSFVPGLAALPGLGIVLVGLALLSQDGLIAGIAYVFAAGSVAAAVYAVTWLL